MLYTKIIPIDSLKKDPVTINLAGESSGLYVVRFNLQGLQTTQIQKKIIKY